MSDRGQGVHGALLRYEVMADIVGVMLIILFGAAVPLTALGHPLLGHILGPIHGILYIVYLATALDLIRRVRYPAWWLLATACAGFVPGLAFVVEYFVVRRVKATLVSWTDVSLGDGAVPTARITDPGEAGPG